MRAVLSPVYNNSIRALADTHAYCSSAGYIVCARVRILSQYPPPNNNPPNLPANPLHVCPSTPFSERGVTYIILYSYPAATAVSVYVYAAKINLTWRRIYRQREIDVRMEIRRPHTSSCIDTAAVTWYVTYTAHMYLGINIYKKYKWYIMHKTRGHGGVDRDFRRFPCVKPPTGKHAGGLNYDPAVRVRHYTP